MYSRLYEVKQLHKQRKYLEIANIYRELLSKHPKDTTLIKNLSDVLRNHGWNMWWEGKYEEAKKSFEEASKLYNKLNLPFESFKVLRGKGLCESCLGMYDEAIYSFKLALKKLNSLPFRDYPSFKKTNLKLEEVKTLLYITIDYAKKGDWETVLKYIEKSKNKLKELHQDKYYAYYLGLLLQGKGIALLYTGKYTQAIKTLSRAKRLFVDTKNKYKIANINENIAVCLQQLARDNKAIELLTNTIKIYEEQQITRFQPYLYRAISYERLGQYKLAFEDYQTAVNIIETKRNEIKSDIYRETFFADKLKVYDLAISNCLTLNLPFHAYDLVQRAKSRCFNELLEKIGEKENFEKQNTYSNNSFRKIFSQIMKLRKEIDSKYSRLNSLDTTDIDFKELQRLERQYEQLLKNLKEEKSQFAEIVTVTSLPVNQIQDLLEEKNIILEYYITENKLIIFHISKHDFGYKVINVSKAEIENFVENTKLWLLNLATIDTAEDILKQDAFNWYNKKLSEILFSPVEDIVSQYQQIIFIPHQILHCFPFALLLDREQRYIVETYEIVIFPTPRLLNLTSLKTNKNNIVVIANTTGDLHYANLEGEQIKNILPRTKIFSGRQATKSMVIKNMLESDIIHFACHAKVNLDNPLFSYIVVANDNVQERQFTRIELNEILNLNLKSDLVVLSCCETAIGKIVPGDEITCFPRAFIIAGAKSVVVTLWEIDDKSTAKLISEFYKNIFIYKKTKSQALKNAQCYMIKKGYSPYHWAGFQLIGSAW